MLEEAVAAYQSAISQNPNFYLAYHNLGETLEKLGRWEEAVEAYRRAVQLKPGAAWSHWGLSQALQQVGQVEEARQRHQQALEIEPELSQLPFVGSSVKAVKGSPDQLNTPSDLLKQSQEKIRQFHNKHWGERCVIIGNGPSLNEMDLSFLKHEICFGTNKIYLGFERWEFSPTYYVAVNPFVIEQSVDEIRKISCPKFIGNRGISYFDPIDDIIFIKTFPSPGELFSKRPDVGLNEGCTVTYVAMQLAYYMGFNEVILIGVDHHFVTHGTPHKAVVSDGNDPNHFDPRYFGQGLTWQLPDLENSEKSYQVAKQVFEESGRRIIDATVNGRCQVFPKQDYQQVFKEYFQDINNDKTEQSKPDNNAKKNLNQDLSHKFQDLEPGELEREEKALIKKHPYPHKIFLPTSKIPLKDRVEGLKKVLKVYHEYDFYYKNKLIDLRQKFKDRDRAFIIGNGPSLNYTDLELLREEVTFGVNGIFLKTQENGWQPTFYVVEDHLVAEDRSQNINSFTGIIKLFPIYLAYCLDEGENTIFFNHRPRKSYPNGFDFSTDASLCTYTGCTVTFTCMQLAYYLGFKNIYLIGVDADYRIPSDVKVTQEYQTETLDMESDDVNHFHPDYFGKGYRWHDPQVGKMKEAYTEARAVCNRTKVNIYNATRGGKLEVFPRVDYYTLFDLTAVYPRLLIIDFTKIGSISATGQIKKNLFAEWSKAKLVQVYSENPTEVGLYSELERDEIIEDEERLLKECERFNPQLIYYRPVKDRPRLHDFACKAIEKLGVPLVTHIMDDWLERLKHQGPELFARFDRSTRVLLYQSAARLSISEAMSAAFQDRYGLNFIPIANCIDPSDWLIHEQPNNQQKSQDNSFTIRYVGGLSEDMNLESLCDISKAIVSLQKEVKVVMEIYHTQAKFWREKAKRTFAGLPNISVQEANFSYKEYCALLCNADALVIAYNFDEHSIRYVKYSMANKLPECLAAGKPVLVYGPREVATVDYAAKTEAVQLVSERDSQKLKSAIRDLVQNPELCRHMGEKARKFAFEHHSAKKIRHQFYSILRKSAKKDN
jgi:glycosyltransferase involved in cell wall biosynthesis